LLKNNRVYIIAEAGVNHNGSLTRAKEMIVLAAKAGADAIKFQTFKAENLVSKNAPKAEYQLHTTNSEESQYQMLKRIELDYQAYLELVDCAKKNNIEFLSSPFDMESVDLLINKCKVDKIKISSGEITNAPLILKIAKTGRPVILSTGMTLLGEIELALGVLAFGYLNIEGIPSVNAFLSAYSSLEGQTILKNKVTLLHCTTEYPAPIDEVNLKSIDTIKNVFHLPVGYSDHTEGIAISLAAVARGAVVIEKHFTLNKNLPGPDHQASLEPEELNVMVKGIRQIELALGNGMKLPTKTEVKNKFIARKSLVAGRKIKKGDIFTENNLAVKRPGDGISPSYYWNWLGKTAQKDYDQDEKV